MSAAEGTWDPKTPFGKSIKRVVEIMTAETKNALSTRDSRIAALEKRMAAMEGRIAEFAYKGVWQAGTVYRECNSVTDNGSLWICISQQSTQRPGDGQDWRLAVKRGKDGRDARP